jgi:hypothetical protein
MRVRAKLHSCKRHAVAECLKGGHHLGRGSNAPTTAYCRKQAREPAALAEREPQHKTQYMNDAAARLLLGSRLEEIEIQVIVAIMYTKLKEPACVPTIGKCLTRGEQHIAAAQRDPLILRTSTLMLLYPGFPSRRG